MTIRTRKIGILGVGNVGSHCAFSLATQGEVDELVFVDLKKDKSKGEALDLEDAISFLPHNIKVIVGVENDLVNTDIIIVSAGPLPKADQSRLDTLDDTINCIANSIEKIVEGGFNGIFICISNPADVIADFILKKSKFPRNRVFSTGTSLDSSRLKRILARELDVAYKSIIGYSIGEHGGSQIIPWSHVSIGGKPINEYVEDNNKVLDYSRILHETRFSGYDVLTGKGSTEFGISSAVCDIVKSIYHDENRVIPVSTLLQGEYNEYNVFASVPCIIGQNGIEEIIELRLKPEEMEGFSESCEVIRKYVALADKYLEV